ncbi:MAG: hypothetical protein BGN88_11620 [Clostridiales bacterium 43-6]|nr:MAG: hypothetical protein BGN88_11620 [Clostridiales bacterium 43-6]
MDTVEEKLKTPYGYAVISQPYTSPRADIGFVTTQVEGGYQNGSIYSHANSFKIKADAMLKRNDDAYRTIKYLIPDSEYHKDTDAEPYQIPNSYFAPEAGYRGGMAGQSFITGTAGWVYNSVFLDILGIKPSFDGLILDPCLPSGWTDVSAVRMFRKSKYRFRFIKEKGIFNDIKEIKVNGNVIDGNLLPYGENQEFLVEVKL